LNIPKG